VPPRRAILLAVTPSHRHRREEQGEAGHEDPAAQVIEP